MLSSPAIVLGNPGTSPSAAPAARSPRCATSPTAPLPRRRAGPRLPGVGRHRLGRGARAPLSGPRRRDGGGEGHHAPLRPRCRSPRDHSADRRPARPVTRSGREPPSLTTTGGACTMRPRDLSLTEGGGALEILWEDGASTALPARLLRASCRSAPASRERTRGTAGGAAGRRHDHRPGVGRPLRGQPRLLRRPRARDLPWAYLRELAGLPGRGRRDLLHDTGRDEGWTRSARARRRSTATCSSSAAARPGPWPRSPPPRTAQVLLLEKAHVRHSGALAMGMDGVNNAVDPRQGRTRRTTSPRSPAPTTASSTSAPSVRPPPAASRWCSGWSATA